MASELRGLDAWKTRVPEFHGASEECEECFQPHHYEAEDGHRCQCGGCVEGRREFEWEREQGI